MPDFDINPNLTEGTEVTETPPIPVTYDYLRVSQDLQNRLTAIETNGIAKVLLQLCRNVGPIIPELPNSLNFFGISLDDPTKISYLNYSRATAAYKNGTASRVWEDKDYRYHSSAGKVVRKIFAAVDCRPENRHYVAIINIIASYLSSVDRLHELENHDDFTKLFTEAEFDQFNNLFRIEGFRQGDAGEVIYVQGHWIANFYHEKNYASLSGSLGNSCMRYDKAQRYLDIYTKNLSVCKLAILLNKEGKLQGRALVWSIGDATYYDRIYATSDLIQDRMKAFFLVNNIQTCYPGYSIYKTVTLESDHRNLDVNKRVLLSHDYYPYMDSLKYLDEEHSILSNEESQVSNGSYYILNDTSGQYEEQGSHNAECPNCGREDHQDSMCWIDTSHDEYYHESLCDNCAIYSEYHNSYVTRANARFIENISTWVLETELTIDYTNEYILTDSAVELVDGSFTYDGDEDLCEYLNGGYFLIGNSAFEYVEYNSSYYKPEECVETKDGEMVPEELTTEHDGEIWLTSELTNHLNLNLI